MTYYVYVLVCRNNKHYIGCTNNLKERMKRHNNGYVPATKLLLPVKLTVYFAFLNKYIAFNFEKYLKSGSHEKNISLKNTFKIVVHFSSFQKSTLT